MQLCMCMAILVSRVCTWCCPACVASCRTSYSVTPPLTICPNLSSGVLVSCVDPSGSSMLTSSALSSRLAWFPSSSQICMPREAARVKRSAPRVQARPDGRYFSWELGAAACGHARGLELGRSRMRARTVGRMMTESPAMISFGRVSIALPFLSTVRLSFALSGRGDATHARARAREHSVMQRHAQHTRVASAPAPAPPRRTGPRSRVWV